MREKSIIGVNPPKTERGKEKMNKLVDAAEIIFGAKGFYGASVMDICKKAKTAVGTFYIYFDDKIAIYRYLVYRYKLSIKRALNESIADCATRYERERAGIKCFLMYAWHNPLCYDIIWGSLSVDKQIFEEYYIDFAKSYAAALVRDNAELNDIDIITMAYTLMGITNFVGLKFLFEEDYSDERLEHTIDAVMRILTEGIFKHAQTT